MVFLSFQQIFPLQQLHCYSYLSIYYTPTPILYILGEFKIPGIFVLGITQASFISHISSTAPNCESCAHTDLASS